MSTSSDDAPRRSPSAAPSLKDAAPPAPRPPADAAEPDLSPGAARVLDVRLRALLEQRSGQSWRDEVRRAQATGRAVDGPDRAPDPAGLVAAGGLVEWGRRYRVSLDQLGAAADHLQQVLGLSSPGQRLPTGVLQRLPREAQQALADLAAACGR